jgi:DnaJ-class molecular chaperone
MEQVEAGEAVDAVVCGACHGDGEVTIPGEAPETLVCGVCDGSGHAAEVMPTQAAGRMRRDPVLFRPIFNKESSHG